MHLEVPRNRGPNTTLLASMSIEGMGECVEVEGVTTKVLFEAYVDRVLAPRLGAAISVFNSTDALGFFKHYFYCRPARLL